MVTITADRPKDWDSCEVHCFADIHLGDLLCDGNLLNERIRHCEETDNCVVILNGDLCNNATTQSVSDTYAEAISPMMQLQRVVDVFGKLAEQGKIIAMTNGNHERRTLKSDGLDMSAVIATQLGIRDKYSDGAALVFLRFGQTNRQRKIAYTLFCNHGSGGGFKVGGKANRLVGMAEIIDADVYFHSHTHEPLIVKRAFFRTNMGNSSVQRVERLFVNTSSYLDYGGYGEIAEFAPNAKSTPIVYLDGHKRKMTATM